MKLDRPVAQAYAVAKGPTSLRAYRVENVCLERERGFNIAHGYGHGGSGLSFSWGRADEVVDPIQGRGQRRP
ncbi:hypothetical protein [Streptomyces sp. NPDC000410]|uniref:hypothetical protein n=1 Tax=Streptomyces sp. NPDC000410 TaxID=3154254 RepID=UPI00331D27F9